MRRVVLAAILVFHGVAHTNAGMLAADGPRLAPTLLWAAASVCLVAAGFGLFGVRRLEPHWSLLAASGIVASLALLVAYRPRTALVGALLDVALAALLVWAWIPPRPAEAAHGRGRWTAIWEVGAIAFLAYLSAAILTRPWHSRWGATDSELRATLPGDDLIPNAHYTIQHGVTIHAAPQDVWPWLVQLGQDRGGFYSYEWLERLIGDDIRNADRIHPEWQTLREGDLVRAAQPDYLGGVFGRDLGWRVTRLEPGRALVLGGWGAFVLQRVDGGTRFIVRTRGAGDPNVVLAPIGLLLFEPAHFIMERRMLLGVKERAERVAARRHQDIGRLGEIFPHVEGVPERPHEHARVGAAHAHLPHAPVGREREHAPRL